MNYKNYQDQLALNRLENFSNSKDKTAYKIDSDENRLIDMNLKFIDEARNINLNHNSIYDMMRLQDKFGVDNNNPKHNIRFSTELRYKGKSNTPYSYKYTLTNVDKNNKDTNTKSYDNLLNYSEYYDKFDNAISGQLDKFKNALQKEYNTREKANYLLDHERREYMRDYIKSNNDDESSKAYSYFMAANLKNIKDNLKYDKNGNIIPKSINSNLITRDWKLWNSNKLSFSENQLALQKLKQFAEKDKENKPITYYIKKGAKWGGIGGAVAGGLSSTYNAVTIPTETVVDENRAIHEELGLPFNEERAERLMPVARVIAPVFGAGVTGVLGAGLGAGAGAAYGGAKKIYKLINKSDKDKIKDQEYILKKYAGLNKKDAEKAAKLNYDIYKNGAKVEFKAVK